MGRLVVVLDWLALDRRTPLFGLAREPDDTGGFRVDTPPHGYRRTLLAAAAMAAAIALLLHDQVAQLYSVPDAGDPLFSIWRIGWVTHQIFSDPWRLFGANIFYPERLTLTFSDPMILPALMSMPFAAQGLQPASSMPGLPSI